jgi:hypothetical protein
MTEVTPNGEEISLMEWLFLIGGAGGLDHYECSRLPLDHRGGWWKGSANLGLCFCVTCLWEPEAWHIFWVRCRLTSSNGVPSLRARGILHLGLRA